MVEERKYGCIPAYEQARIAKAEGRDSDQDLIEAMVAPWNATNTPRIIEWTREWVKWLEEEAEAKDVLRKYGQFPEPWNIADYGQFKTFKELVGVIQKRNDCAAWAEMRTAIVMALNQYWNGAERSVVPYNPTGIYAYSSGEEPVEGRRFADNGRTIYAIAKAACQVGNFPADEAGDYNGGATFTRAILDTKPEAEKNQTGFAYVGNRTPEELAGIVILSLRAGRPVVIGNDIALRDGTRQDANGMFIADVGGGWGGGHATAAIDYRKVKDTEYVYIANSHGEIYKTGTQTPAFGAYITRSALVRYLSGRFADIMPLTYTERPAGTPDVNLNPHGGRKNG